MEKTMVSVQHLIDSGVNVRVGDEVVLLGSVSAHVSMHVHAVASYAVVVVIWCVCMHAAR